MSRERHACRSSATSPKAESEVCRRRQRWRLAGCAPALQQVNHKKGTSWRPPAAAGEESWRCLGRFPVRSGGSAC